MTRVLEVRLGAVRTGEQDLAMVRDALAVLPDAAGSVLDVARPAPTAAFSRRDQLLPGYDAAAATARRHGYEPMTRPVGGHLAVYGAESLVLHHWAPDPQPREGIRARFALISEAMAQALRELGVDARVGPVPGEYCDGEFSVNVGGRAKLIGTGQRIVRTGYLFSAVVMVGAVDAVRAALTEAYADLGLPFDPATVGAVGEAAPGVGADEVRDVLVTALARVLPAAGPLLVPVG